MDIERLNEISSAIVQSAIEVHRATAPGLLESAYRSCMIYELRERGLSVVLLVHHAQLLYFNVPVLVKGVKRLMNGF
ncbi:MAG: GxxExxY protein [Acidobacteria bacterium]|nr:GxxExxY protein [Acidobacteriota bacterium]